MDIQKEREAFEAAMEPHFFSSCFEREDDGSYAARGLQGAWMGWQARAAMSAEAGPVTITHRPLIRNAINLLGMRRSVAPDVERVIEDLEAMLAGMPTPADSVSAHWLEVAKKAEAGPVAIVDENDDSMWADILPDVTVKAGQLLYAAPQPNPAAVPDVAGMAKALCKHHADLCGVDADDQWAIYGQDFITDVNVMLAAAPAPADHSEQDLGMVGALVTALDGLLSITQESKGVDGYHLNGAIAEWGEFPEVATAWEVMSMHKERLAPAPAGWVPVTERLPDDWRTTIQGAIDELPYGNHLIPRLCALLAAAPSAEGGES